MAPSTPALPHSSTMAGTVRAGEAMMARSIFSGMSEKVWYASMPRDLFLFGLTGKRCESAFLRSFHHRPADRALFVPCAIRAMVLGLNISRYRPLCGLFPDIEMCPSGVPFPEGRETQFYIAQNTCSSSNVNGTWASSSPARRRFLSGGRVCPSTASIAHLYLGRSS